MLQDIYLDYAEGPKVGDTAHYIPSPKRESTIHSPKSPPRFTFLLELLLAFAAAAAMG